MNTLQMTFDAVQVVINLVVIWYFSHLHRRIRRLTAEHASMRGSLEERTLNQAEYDAMADEQKDANQADYEQQQKDSAGS